MSLDAGRGGAGESQATSKPPQTLALRLRGSMGEPGKAGCGHGAPSVLAAWAYGDCWTTPPSRQAWPSGGWTRSGLGLGKFSEPPEQIAG